MRREYAWWSKARNLVNYSFFLEYTGDLRIIALRRIIVCTTRGRSTCTNIMGPRGYYIGRATKGGSMKGDYSLNKQPRCLAPAVIQFSPSCLMMRSKPVGCSAQPHGTHKRAFRSFHSCQATKVKRVSNPLRFAPGNWLLRWNHHSCTVM
jgi:hypothetical protein